MIAFVARAALAAMLLSDCVGHSVKPVSVELHYEYPDNHIPLNEQRDVDILFVIDNSRSMGAEQAKLAANFAAFIEVLEAQDVQANYRIGVTTTDNGNPWCPSETTPEAGQMVLSSCKNRLGDFVTDEVDARDAACNDICSLGEDALVIQPTRTHLDENFVRRPWLEDIDGARNLVAGVDMADAFACFGPQGIRGCGFESPLESMYLALSRAKAKDEAEYGFLRPDALLAIVIVTDEVDCSFDKDWADIFSQTGTKQFWSDPSAEYPTSALCWNAGVECVGDPSQYESCEPVDRDIEGLPAGLDEAVLHPISRYRDRLRALEDEKRQLDPEAEIIVALIGGVMPDGSLVYADATEPEFQDQYGIGPGCVGPLGEAALPPVRIRALVDEFTPGNLHSICASDYTGALESIAEHIRSKFIPACFGECVADLDPDTPLVEPHCTVQTNTWPPTADMAECLRTPEGAYAVDPDSGALMMPSDDVHACFGLRVDTDMQTADPRDDISAICGDYGANLEFELAYRPGVPRASGPLTATCLLSHEPDANCPELVI
jgi:hypothetical protein